jgi:phosphate starvation-inducible PhoH-like protein
MQLLVFWVIKICKRMAKKKTIKQTIEEEVSWIENRVNNLLPAKVKIKYKTQKQKNFANLIKEKEITICGGPAGCGKSYLAIATGLELVQEPNNPYHKLIIVKPVVEAGEKIGLLPGTLAEKLEPVLASSVDILDKIIGKVNRIKLEKTEVLFYEPLAYMRGKTFDNSVVIIEEAQNMSPEQMKTVLTRIGENSKFVISGDLDQSDRYHDVKSTGLYDALEKHKNIEEIGFFEFDVNDIVRNPLITKILNNYKRV